METTITKPVKEIPADEKKTLEGMLGASLEAEQQVFILAYTPGRIPSVETRANARRGVEQILSENQAFSQKNGINSTDADEAVAEAMRQIRRRA